MGNNKLKQIGQKESFHTTLENLFEGCQIIDFEYRYLFINNAAVKQGKKTSEELLGHTMMEMYPGIETTPMFSVLRQCMQERIPRQMENEFIFEDGTKGCYFQSFEPVPEGVYIMSTNITERNQAEEALKESEERFRTLFENSTIGIYRTTPDGQILLANPSLIKLLGYSSFEELAGRNLAEDGFEPSFERTHFMDIIKREGEVKGLESAWTRMDGTTVFISESARGINDKEGKIIYYDGIVEDITLRKQAEEMLRKSEQMLQMVLDNFPGVVFWKDRHSNYLGCNQSFATGAGLNSPAEIVGKTDLNLPWASTEAISYRKDDLDVMESGKGRLHIVEMQHQSDGQVIWLDTSKFPLRDSLGQVIGVIGVSNDISMLKMAEQELINTNKELAFQNAEKEKQAIELIIAKEKAEESDRLKSAFLTNMSHEIRTPMNGILVFAELLKEPNLSSDDQQDFIQTIQISGERMLDTINSIVDISKIESGLMKVDIKETNINEKIEFAYKFFKPEVEIKGLQFLFKNGLPTKEAIIKTDNEKVYGILINLIKNAIKFTNVGSIEFGYEKKGKYLEFFVKDSGIGISENQNCLLYTSPSPRDCS